MGKSHSGALTTKARVCEACAIETAAKGISIGPGKGTDLSIGVEILVATHGPTLMLSVGGKSRLVEWRTDARTGAEAPNLRRHGVVSMCRYVISLERDVEVPMIRGHRLTNWEI